MSYNKETGMYEGYIYCITNNVNGKQYIGQTSTTVELRFKSHKYRAKSNPEQYIHNSMSQYGVENFTVKEIEKVKFSELSELSKKLDELEIYYIKFFNTLNPNGYNNTTGGKDNDGFQIKNRNVYQFDLKGNLICQYNSLQDACEKTGYGKTGISKCCLLKTNSSFGFVWRYEDTLQEYNGYISHWVNTDNIDVSLSGQHIMKEIIQYDLDGKIVKEYLNLNDAYFQNKDICTKSGIRNCCYGITKIHRSYVWRFSNDAFEKYPVKYKQKSQSQCKKKAQSKKISQIIKKPKENNRTKPIVQYDRKFNIIAEYSNVNSINFLTESQKNSVILCCCGKIIVSHGYIWRFKGDDIFKYKTQRERHRSVVMMTDNGEFICKFSTAKEAADYVKGDRSCIIKCCKGIRLGTHKGYKWKYLEEFEV